MNENENSSVINAEQPVTTVNEPLQPAAPVENVVPTEPVVPVTTPVEPTPVAPVENVPVEPVAPAAPVEPQPTVSPEPTVAQPETTIAQPALQPIGEPEQSKKKSMLPIVIIITIVLIIAGVLVYFLFFMKVSGKQVVNGTINKFFATAEKISEEIDDAFIVDYKKDIIKSEGYLKLSVESEDPQIKTLIGDVKSVSLKYDVQVNAKDLEGYFNFSSNENDNEIINLSGLLSNKVFYFNSNVFETVYKYDASNDVDWNSVKEFVNKLPEYDSRIVSKLTKKAKKYLQDAIKDEYITTKDGSFTVDGVDIKGTKTTLTITQKVANEMAKSITTSAKNDDELITLLSNCTSVSKEDIIKELNNALEELENAKNLDENSKVYINIYTTSKGKFLGFELLVQDQAIATAVSQNDITTIKIKMDQEIKLTYDEKKKELTWVNEAANNKGEKIVITFKDDGIKIEFSMTGLKLTLEEEYKNSKTRLDDKLTASVEIDDTSVKGKGSLELTCSLEKANEVKKFDISNAKDIRTMTEYEQQEISNKITQAIQNSQIGKSLMTIAQAQAYNNKAVFYTTNTLDDNF